MGREKGNRWESAGIGVGVGRGWRERGGCGVAKEVQVRGNGSWRELSWRGERWRGGGGGAGERGGQAEARFEVHRLWMGGVKARVVVGARAVEWVARVQPCMHGALQW